jgi:AcrR family transcriptional regulator
MPVPRTRYWDDQDRRIRWNRGEALPRRTPTTAPDSKGARTRRRLLDAAAAEIARHGVAGAGLGAIAAAAGLRTGSIYFHFESKEQLFEAVLEEGLHRTLEHLDIAMAGLPERASAVSRLRAAIHAHAIAVSELRAYTVIVLAPDLPTGHAPAGNFRTLRRDYLDRWTGLVADVQHDGALPAGLDPRLTRDLLFGAINAVGLAGGAPDEIAGAVHALLGLRPRHGLAGLPDDA